jgi:hypothetical protein
VGLVEEVAEKTGNDYGALKNSDGLTRRHPPRPPIEAEGSGGPRGFPRLAACGLHHGHGICHQWRGCGYSLIQCYIMLGVLARCKRPLLSSSNHAGRRPTGALLRNFASVLTASLVLLGGHNCLYATYKHLLIRLEDV